MKRSKWLFLSVIGLLAGCSARRVQPDCSGTIECTQILLAAQAGGRVLQLPPQEGAVVRRGDGVAQIDPADYILRRDECRALLSQAEAQLALVRAGFRDEEIQRAREQVRESQAAAMAASNDLQRVVVLFAGNSATAKQLDDAKSAADRTAAPGPDRLA